MACAVMASESLDARRVPVRAEPTDEDALLTWELLFRVHGPRDGRHVFRGTTHIQFASDGRVAYLRDYWDAA